MPAEETLQPRAAPALRACALLALLLASSLLPLVADAQSPTPPPDSSSAPQPAPFLCFGRTIDGRGDVPSKEAQGVQAPTPAAPDPNSPAPPPPAAPTGKECPGGIPDVPNFFEGESVVMYLYNIPPGTLPVVRVSCSTNCHELAGHNYYARWGGDSAKPLVFPSMFVEGGPNGEAPGNPTGDHAPRYNGTWVASILLDGNQIDRSFRTWLLDSFRGVNSTVMPGESHEIHAYGFEDQATVHLLIERRLPNGTYTRVLDQVQGPIRGGAHFFEWVLPREESRNIALCGEDHMRFDCYRVRILGSQTSKANEVEYFPVAPADIKASFLVGQYAQRAPTPAPPQPETIERTGSAFVALDFHYPGGRVRNGPLFTTSDLPPAPANEERALRVHVERSNVTKPAFGPLTVDDVPLRYNPSLFRWETTWTVPRDLALDPTAVFQLSLPESRDLYGNRIPALILGNYSIVAAQLKPVVAASFDHLERTDTGRIALSIQYHNGTPLSDRDNATPLVGCFVKDLGNDALAACAAGFRGVTDPLLGDAVNGSFENGVWVFRERYPRDFVDLSPHRFVLQGGVLLQDKWGNTINATTLAPYDILAGSPRIEFSTVMRGRATERLERGQTGQQAIGVLAHITYADGTPYNHSARFDPKSDASRLLNVTLTKRGEGDAVQSVSTLWLREVDGETGQWFAPLDVKLDDPIGRWSFDLYVNDTVSPVPNLNRTSFDRSIIAAPLRFEPLVLSSGAPPAGALLSFNFRVHDPDGSPSDPDGLRRTLAAQVYRYDAKNRTAIGIPISGLLQPDYNPTYEWWAMQYVVPGHLFDGQYVFVVTGRDVAGNVLPDDAYSRPFAPQSLVRTRPVVTQPPLSVERNDAATVVFAAQDGDTAISGSGTPVIRVERYDPESGRWNTVAGGSDVRQNDPAIRDHYGVFGVKTTTAIGSYRFVMLGREGAPGYAIITNTSANFTVLPTDVARDLFTLPREEVTKGELVNYHVERREGDRVSDVKLLLNGRETGMGRPLLTAEGDHINVSWRVPFDAPNGNYTIRIIGRDQFGNTIEIDSPAIQATAAQLSGKIIGDPPHVVARGTPATLLFGVTYPSGAFYNDPTVPSVVVHNASGLVAVATVQRSGVTFQASWTPPATAASVPYWFEVQGAGEAGNAFPDLKSTPFELTTGSFRRAAAADVPVNNERFGTVPFSVPVSEHDASVRIEVAYYGPGNDVGGIVDETKEPITRTPIPVTRDAATAQYQARFITDSQTPVGAYKMFMTGTDDIGNTIASSSRVFFLKTTVVIVDWQSLPPNTDFGAGKTISLNFTTKYKNGPIMDDAHGRPSVALLVGGASTTEKPAVDWVSSGASGHWQITWTAPAVLVPGDYSFVVGGADLGGNQISTGRSIPYNVPETSVGSAFAKAIPAPGALPVVLAVALVALALSRVRRA